MKKALFALTIFAMAALGAKAQDSVFSYTYQGTTLYYIIDSVGNAIVVPPLHPIASSDTSAWTGYTKPTGAVTVPDSVPCGSTIHAVTGVGNYAFYKCSGLTTVTLPASVTSLGRSAFYSCSALQSAPLSDGMSRISYTCFAGCYALQSVDIPASVSVVDTGAFLLCKGLQTVTFHQGLDTIENSAFRLCTSLDSITLPEGLRYIGWRSFSQDSLLRRINLPLSLKVVFDEAFENNPLLDSVIFPEGLSHLGSYVLMNCSSLSHVQLPQNLEVIPTGLLRGTGIETFVAPPHVHTLYNMALAACPNLHKATLPASVTDLGFQLFSGSPLDTLVVECAVPPTTQNSWFGATFQEYTAHLIVPCGSASAYSADSVWGNFVNIVEDCCGDVFPYTYQGNTLYYIIDSVGNAIVVPPLSYYDTLNDATWTGYTEPSGAVVVPDSVPFGGTMHAVTEVGHEAFYHCELITSITLPASVTVFGEYAFSKCGSLQHVVLPEGLTFLGDFAFADCHNLQSINLPSTLRYLGIYCFSFDSALSSPIVIPSGVDTVPNRAFSDCLSLQSVTVSEGVKVIGPIAFASCISLASVSLPSSLRSIEEFAFWGDTSLTSIAFPDSLRFIGMASFDYCEKLANVNLPASLDSIGDYAFEGCNAFDSIVFPDHLQYLGEGAVSICLNLTYCHLPEQLRVVSAYLLSGTGIERLVIPENVTRMDYGALSDCYQLDTLVLKCSVPPTMGNDIFTDYTATLVVPCGSSEAYSQDPVWGLFSDIIEDCGVGIPEEDFPEVKIRVENSCIVVDGAEGETVSIFDINGRSVRNSNLPSGVYIVIVGNRPARKVVVIE